MFNSKYFENLFKPARLAYREVPDNVPPTNQEDVVFPDQQVQSRTADQKAREAAEAAFREANKVHPEVVAGAKAGGRVEAEDIGSSLEATTESLKEPYDWTKPKTEAPKAKEPETTEEAELRLKIQDARELKAKIEEYKDFSSGQVRQALYEKGQALMDILSSVAPRKVTHSDAADFGKYKYLESRKDVSDAVKTRNAGLAQAIAKGAASRSIG